MMKTIFKIIALPILIIMMSSPVLSQKEPMLPYDYYFSGGPDGGTFKFFAHGITDYSNSLMDFKIKTYPSAGSVDNLQKVNNRSADLGITYSGDLYLGRNGMLGGSRSRQYRNVYALAYLYGAPAHLVVLKDSGINSIADLSDGKKVAIGKVGSGAAAAGERLFRNMDIWREIKPQYLGYAEGAEALIAKQVDALWVFSGFPNAAVTRSASMKNIKLISVYDEAKEKNGFFEDFPFYQKVIIPAGTYKGVDYDVISYQDSTLLTAGRHVPADNIEELLNTIYTDKGLEYLVSMKSTAKAMSLESGLIGIVTPMHRGAIAFWESKGKKLTIEQKSP